MAAQETLIFNFCRSDVNGQSALGKEWATVPLLENQRERTHNSITMDLQGAAFFSFFSPSVHGNILDFCNHLATRPLPWTIYGRS